MTREEQIAEKKLLIADIKKQISKLERKHNARLSRRKPTNDMFIQLRRIGKDVQTILSVRALAIQAYCIQSQPIAPDFIKGGIEAKVNYIESKGKEPLIIPHVPEEQRHNPDRD